MFFSFNLLLSTSTAKSGDWEISRRDFWEFEDTLKVTKKNHDFCLLNWKMIH